MYGRYVQEVVEAFGFCPWARVAREQGRVRRWVVTENEPSIAHLLEVIESAERDPNVDIGLVLLPRLVLDRVPFQRFVAKLRTAYARGAEERREFAMAEFHPNADADAGTVGRVTTFVRRSPDPTIQLVRLAVLDDVRQNQDQGTSYVDPSEIMDAPLDHARHKEPLSQRIAHANQRTIGDAGLAQIVAAMDDIVADRDRSYARLGVPLPPWGRGADPPR